MCTGLELALVSAAVSGAGGLISQKQATDQQAATVKAENQQLSEFLKRNKDRSKESMALFDKRQDAYEAAPMAEAQGAAETKRADAMRDTISAESSANPTPLRGSAASSIGDVYAAEGESAKGKAMEKAQSRAKLASFGDVLFGRSLDDAGAGRKINTISGFAQSDANMLPLLQDLRGTEASIKNRPGIFGPLLQGLGSAGGLYAGAKSGVR